MTTILMKVLIIGNAVILFFFTGFFMFAKADTIQISNGSSSERYHGRIFYADQSKVDFDVECTGNIVTFPWRKGVETIYFGNNCLPTDGIGAGGFENICGHKFMFVDSYIEWEFNVNKFRYKKGVLELDDGVVLKFDKMEYIRADGSRVKVRGDSGSPFRAYMQNTKYWCKQN